MELQQIILELRKTMTQKQIAAALGSSQATISRIMRGHLPAYDVGKKLEALALARNVFTLRQDKQDLGINP